MIQFISPEGNALLAFDCIADHKFQRNKNCLILVIDPAGWEFKLMVNNGLATRPDWHTYEVIEYVRHGAISEHIGRMFDMVLNEYTAIPGLRFFAIFDRSLSTLQEMCEPRQMTLFNLRTPHLLQELMTFRLTMGA